MLKSSGEHIKKRQPLLTSNKEGTTLGCPATTPCGPGTTPQQPQSTRPVALSPATALVSAAKTHRGPPASGRACSSTRQLHNRPILLLAAHSSPLGCYGCACRRHSLLAAKQLPAAHHSTAAIEQCSASTPADCTITSGIYTTRRHAVQPYYAQ